jgi:hypothetical protein
MLPEIERFQKWLRRKAPNASTHIHYTSDIELFFAWRHKPPNDVKVQDIDLFIDTQNPASLELRRHINHIPSYPPPT